MKKIKWWNNSFIAVIIFFLAIANMALISQGNGSTFVFLAFLGVGFVSMVIALRAAKK